MTTFHEVLNLFVKPEKVEFDLINGDCRDVLKRLKTNSVHMVLTDPPYFIDGLDNQWRKGEKLTKQKQGCVGGLPVGMKFDAAQGIALQEFMFQVSKELKRVLVPGGFFLSFSQPRLAHRMAIGIEDSGFEIRDVYAWHFMNQAQMKAFSQNHFVEKMNVSKSKKNKIKKQLKGRKTPQLRPQFESIILAQNPKEGTFVENWLKYRTGLVDVTQTLEGAMPVTVMQVEKPDKKERCHGHMTPKPVRLLTHLIELFSTKNQVILDPFLGSGSTALAACTTKRSCIGIEINEDYIKIPETRLEELQ